MSKTSAWMKNQQIGLIISYILLALDSVIGIFYTPLLIRSLGETQYGLYDIVNSITSYIAIADIGLGATITRYIIKYKTEQNKTKEENCIKTALITYSVIAIACALIGLIVMIFLPQFMEGKEIGASLQEAQMLLLISVGNIVLTLFIHAFSGIVLAYSFFSLEKILKILRIIIRFSLVLILVSYTGKAITLALIDIVLTILMICAFLFFFMKEKIGIFKGKFEKPLLKSMLGFTVAILFQSIINQINTTSGKLIVGWRATNFDQVTVYGVIVQIYFIYCNMATVIQNIYYPSIGEAVFLNKDTQELTEKVIEPSRLQATILYVILIGFWCFGQEFVQLWVGIESKKIWLCASILMTFATLHLSQNTISCILKSKNKLRAKTIILGCGALVALLISIIGSIWWDTIYMVTIGVTTGMIICDTIAMNIYYSCAQIINMKMFFKVFFNKHWIVVVLSLIIAIGINMLIPNYSWITLILKIAVLVVVYLGLMVLIGFNNKEKQRIKKIFHKQKKEK